MDIDVTKLKNVVIGLYVGIIDDTERRLEDEAPIRRGYVKKILSKNDNEKGIKVQLTNGRKGRIEEIYSKNEIKKENFKFYNEFFYEKRIFTLWDRANSCYLSILRKNKVTDKNEITAFLFSNADIGREFLKKLDDKNIVLKGLSKKVKIAENFKEFGVKKFIIDEKRKISYDKLLEWEKYLTRY